MKSGVATAYLQPPSDGGKMQIEFEGSFNDAITSGCNLFLGAGFSVLARNTADLSLPVGGMLADELRTQFAIDPDRSLGLPQLCTLIGFDRSQDLDDYLRARFTVGSFDSRYAVLKRAKIDSIFTTNVDDLIQRIYAGSVDHYLNDIDSAGTAVGMKYAIDLVMLHGSVRNRNRQLRFGTLDLASAFPSDPDRWMLFRQRLNEKPTFFWGYSLQDAGTLQALTPPSIARRSLGLSWVQVRPAQADSPLVQYLKALDFKIVVAETDEILDYLNGALETEGAPTDSKSRALQFHNIPTAAEAVQRPIEDFFLGAAPSWSDIYSTHIARSAHHTRLVDLIKSKKNTIITGIPGSGKTTLLMQAAIDSNYRGPIILEAGMTEPRAELLVRQLAGERALVLLDNVSNDIGALECLGRSKAITLVAADRDYNLGSVSHRISNFEVVNVTGLAPQDLQLIWQTIPARLRRGKFTPPVMQRGVSPSLFEFTQSNISEDPLTERIIEALRDLRNTNPELAELLLVTCYTHYCRTPLAMDTILGYFHDRISDYRAVYDLLTAAGQLLCEYEGSHAIENQDYFSARSTILAEVILLKGSSALLRQMLTTFHRKVSSARIAAYETFRRRAFDSRLFLRAFHITKEGADLYDLIYERQQTPYVLQQKALFLADRRQFLDAFRSIDSARSQIARENWTIENSYYKILFNANIDHASANPGEARPLLQRALEGLRGCFIRDDRKAMHALVYGDCSLKFTEHFRDHEARQVLEVARAQLESVKVDQPWMDRPGYLLKEINIRFRDFD